MIPHPGSPTRVKIDFAQASDPGRDPNKQVNEDSCGYAETKLGHLAVLCDGMGGHQGGRDASRTAIATIFELIEQTPPGATPAQALKMAIEEAGRRVYRLGGPPENRGRPGSTVVAMLLHDRGVDVAHVGDSRAFVIRAGQIYPLTRDHSMVQGLIDAGMLTEQQAIGHPDANKITRALGMKPEVEVEVRPEPMELYPGDVLLMASDGLTDLALNNDILGCVRQALASGPLDHACQMLVQMANDRGGHDNITVQMARVVEVGTRAQTIPGEPAAPGGAGARPPVHAETIAMTRPDAPAPPSARSPQPGAPGPTAPWGPIPPTSPDVAAPQNARPTAVDPALAGSAGATQVEGAEPRPTEPGGPPAARPSGASLAGYRLDGSPAALPMPPPASAGYVAAAMGPTAGAAGGAPGSGHGFQPPAGTHTAPGYGGGPAAPPGGHPAYGQYPGEPGPSLGGASLSTPGARPSRGGIVFVIIGLSAAIAVLLVLLLWALLPG